LDFKVTRRPPPIITAEWSNKIEQIIKTRVASDLFDDPKRTMIKEKKENQDINIIFEKSSKGLAELYEEDWNKQYNNSKEEKTQDKIEIEEMMSDLFTMFTALTNSTFIGDRVKNDNNAIKDIEAIEIKDVSKFVSSDKLLKNNFEKTINNYNPKKAETTTKTEQTVDENKKSRRQMKRKVHKKIYEKNLKKKMNSLSKDYDSKFEVKMAMKKQKDKDDKTNIKSNELKSSKFFNNLQQKREEGNTAKTVESENKKAKLFKL
jgi:U3 small nucleolar RNA-associated protein MPP10